MDEVPIVTAEPVKPSVSPVMEKKAVKRYSTFRNFIRVSPLGLIVAIQAFLFGRAIGNYTSFPLFTLHSYVIILALFSLTLIVQMMIRSMVFSTVFGGALVCGILNAWFGDFWNPIMTNFKEVMNVVKTAWSSRNIPFPILVSAFMTFLSGAGILLSFFLSIFVKYFFEAFFGNEWGDGRPKAFISAIIFLLIIHTGFYGFFTKLNPRVNWHILERYAPVEQFCSPVPSGAIVSDSRIWNIDGDKIKAIDPSDGIVTGEKAAAPIALMPQWSKSGIVMIAEAEEFVAYGDNLYNRLWSCRYPEKLPDDTEQTNDPGGSSIVPLVIRNDLDDEIIPVMLDNGYWCGISLEKGTIAWLKGIDSKVHANRLTLEDFVSGDFVLRSGNMFIFSCLNGIVKAHDKYTGDVVWAYSDKDAKFSGVGQRGYLSKSGTNILVSLPSGAFILLESETGKIIYDRRASGYNPVTAGYRKGNELMFINQDGDLLGIKLDSGEQFTRVNLLPAKVWSIPFIPYSYDLEKGFSGFRTTLSKLSPDKKSLRKAVEFPKRAFVTKPVFENSFMYIGTQDGWVICLHEESLDEKWRVNIGGELHRNSLFIHPKGLLVRTKSGSITCLKKGME